MASFRASEICNCHGLRLATRHLTRHYDSALGTFGLTADGYAILAILNRRGSTFVRDLSQSLILDRSTMAYTLKRLVTRKLVTIERSDHDRRTRIVTITSAGKDLFAEAKVVWLQINDRVDRQLGPDRSHVLRQILKEIESFDLL